MRQAPEAAPDLEPIVRAVLARRSVAPARRSVLCGVSGIDASGKGYVASRVSAELSARGLDPPATIDADETIYFPAQRVHFALDEPPAAADLIVPNDFRLTVSGS
jgi:hypothetical protein